jgi:hypothetical protein
VLFSLEVDDAADVERRLHHRFAEYRTNASREFFNVAPERAILGLLEEAGVSAAAGAVGPPASSDALPALARAYGPLLDPTLAAAATARASAASSSPARSCRSATSRAPRWERQVGRHDDAIGVQREQQRRGVPHVAGPREVRLVAGAVDEPHVLPGRPGVAVPALRAPASCRASVGVEGVAARRRGVAARRDSGARPVPRPGLVGGRSGALAVRAAAVRGRRAAGVRGLRRAGRPAPEPLDPAESHIRVEDRWDRVTVACVRMTEPGRRLEGHSRVVAGPLPLASGRAVWLTAGSEAVEACEPEPEPVPASAIVEPMWPERHGVKAPGLMVRGVPVETAGPGQGGL